MAKSEEFNKFMFGLGKLQEMFKQIPDEEDRRGASENAIAVFAFLGGKETLLGAYQVLATAGTNLQACVRDSITPEEPTESCADEEDEA